MQIEVRVIPDLTTDSGNYEVIYEGIKLTKGVPGAAVEIGLRLGGGSKCIIDGMVDSDQTNEKPLIAIDPYGNIEYYRDEIFKSGRCDYNNQMRDECMINMYLYCRDKGVNFYFFNMEDTEYFKRFADGVPVYNEYKSIMNQYSFVHFDGPHSVEALNDEVGFFHSRLSIGGVMVFDDVNMYQHDDYHEALLARGYECYMETDRKNGYVKKFDNGQEWEPVIPTKEYVMTPEAAKMYGQPIPGQFNYVVNT